MANDLWLHLVRSMVLAALALPESIDAQVGNGEPFAPAYHAVELPHVPIRFPRPLGEPNNATQRDTGDTLSFLQSVRGNDAVLRVLVGQGRLLTTAKPIITKGRSSVIAIGDPTVVDFEVLPNPQMIRLVGNRAGTTDLSFVTADGEVHSYEVRVEYDLSSLQALLGELFPNALVRIRQIQGNLAVEGQVRDPSQAVRIVETVQAYLTSVSAERSVEFRATGFDPALAGRGSVADNFAAPEEGNRPNAQVTVPQPMVINLLQIPAAQQVMLQVRMAELSRTRLREVGADLSVGGSTLFGTALGNGLADAVGTLSTLGNAASVTRENSTASTAFAILPRADLNVMIRLLQENGVLNILAEPNLVAMSGHEASFLAGGEFPIPITQGTVANSSVSVEFKDFGVQLRFLPIVQENGHVRLTVTPEVSSIDFTLGTTLVVGGDPVPGLNSRRAHTTVEMLSGQTLAIAGLMQTQVESQSQRIPGLGKIPFVGPLFSNKTHKRQNKELLVLVTPHLVAPMCEDQVPALPGEELRDPTDREFYLESQNRSAPPTRADSCGASTAPLP